MISLFVGKLVFLKKIIIIILFSKISLKEALCSYTTVIKHLDGRVLALSSIPGQVIQPGKGFFNLLGDCIISKNKIR